MALGRQNLLTEPPADLGLIAGFGDFEPPTKRL